MGSYIFRLMRSQNSVLIKIFQVLGVGVGGRYSYIFSFYFLQP